VSPVIAKVPALKGLQGCVNPTSTSAKPVHKARTLIAARCASPAVKPKFTG
jgi:hypothetical protein